MTNGADDVFKALADVNRRRIVSTLCEGPRVAGDLAKLVGLAPNAVSFHLKWLRAARLVTVQRQGRHLRYAVDAAALAVWRGKADSMFQVAAAEGTAPAPDRRRRSSDRPRRRGRARSRTKRVERPTKVVPAAEMPALPPRAPMPDSLTDPLPTELL